MKLPVYPVTIGMLSGGDAVAELWISVITPEVYDMTAYLTLHRMRGDLKTLAVEPKTNCS